MNSGAFAAGHVRALACSRTERCNRFQRRFVSALSHLFFLDLGQRHDVAECLDRCQLPVDNLGNGREDRYRHPVFACEADDRPGSRDALCHLGTRGEDVLQRLAGPEAPSHRPVP